MTDPKILAHDPAVSPERGSSTVSSTDAEKLSAAGTTFEEKPLQELSSGEGCKACKGSSDGQEKSQGRPLWTRVLVLLLALLLLFNLLLLLTPGGRGLVDAAQGRSSFFLAKERKLDDKARKQEEKLELIYDILKQNYYRELTDEEMIEAMYDGLLDKMDSQFTFYLSPESNAEMEESMKGEYSGIGALVSQKDKEYIISDMFDGSPALEAGLRIGDVFVSVEGKKASEFEDVTALSVMVRGEEGSKVRITVYRPSEKKELDFEVERRKITNANLHYEMLEDKIAYIRISEFNSGVSDNFISAVTDLLKQGAKTFIFDVRNNGGGYVSEVTRMLDALLPKGVLATVKGRNEGKDFEESWDSDDKMLVPDDLRYVIMVNEFSASASELFSGCLRDWDKAVLVGQKTFGKGVGTVTRELSDGSALQITNFTYYLPSGVTVQDKGLTPAYEVELSDEARGLPLASIERSDDLQLMKALELAHKNIENQK